MRNTRRAWNDMSETWIELADADVFPANSGERIGIAAAKGRDDLQDICGQVVEQVRQAYILSGRDLGPDGTIPSGLKERAIAIATWRFVSEGLGKNPGLQTKERQDAAAEARSYLDRIADASVGRTTKPSMGCRPRVFGPSREDGI
jgi:hypothetical protein